MYLMKICTIIGARPQFIKSSIISKELSKIRNIHEIVIHTGQHFNNNMSNIFFEEMVIPAPNYNLDIHSLSHGAMTGRQLEKIEDILQNEKPNLVLVYGDTNSTLAGALAAAKLNIPIAHVEAGLRSFNRKMPEEINRILTDHISDILFAPTDYGVHNLIREGIEKSKIHKVGDVMYDTALCFGKIAEKKSKILTQLNLEPKKYLLATVHREENTDNKEILQQIFAAFGESLLPVVIPLHPRTKKIVTKSNILLGKRIKCIDPVGYLDMIMLEKNALKIVTDSGGVQKEAFFYKVPCITLRNDTEWIELVKNNVNTLVGTNKEKIIEAILSFNPIDFNLSFYGSGEAAKSICKILIG